MKVAKSENRKEILLKDIFEDFNKDDLKDIAKMIFVAKNTNLYFVIVFGTIHTSISAINVKCWRNGEILPVYDWWGNRSI